MIPATRLDLDFDSLEIRLTIHAIDSPRPENDITVTFPRNNKGHREAIQFVDEWRKTAERQNNLVGMQAIDDMMDELHGIEYLNF